MILFTSSIDKYDSIGYTNITRKSGLKEFAPTWSMIWNRKMGNISVEEFTNQYKQLMKESQEVYNSIWRDLTDKEVITLACYCKSGSFCHRLILVDILKEYCKENGKEFVYLGEIE